MVTGGDLVDGKRLGDRLESFLQGRRRIVVVNPSLEVHCPLIVEATSA